MLMLLFSVEELLNSSPTRAQSNYRKVDERKPPLDPTKVKALEGELFFPKTFFFSVFIQYLFVFPERRFCP